MLIAQFGLKKNGLSNLCIVSASVKRQNPKWQRLFQVHNQYYSKCGLCLQSKGRDRGGWQIWTNPTMRGIFKPVKCYHKVQFICLNVFTCIRPIRPCWWQFKGIFHMHIQTKTDSKTLGGPWNVNTGFFRTKGRKEKRKARKGEEWEKPTFLKNLTRSKEFYSQRALIPGITTISLGNPENSLQTRDQLRL